MVPFYLIFALKQRLLDMGMPEEQFNSVVGEAILWS